MFLQNAFLTSRTLAGCLRARVLGQTDLGSNPPPLTSPQAAAESRWSAIESAPPEAATRASVHNKAKTSPRPPGSFQTEGAFQGTPPPQEHPLLPHSQILATVRQQGGSAPPSLSPTFNHPHRSGCSQRLKEPLPQAGLTLHNSRAEGPGQGSFSSLSSTCLLLACLEASLQKGFQMI